MYITITHWNWEDGNRSPKPSHSQVWENEPDVSRVEDLVEVLRCVGPKAVRPLSEERTDEGHLIYIIGGEMDDDLDIVYLEVTQFPPEITYV